MPVFFQVGLLTPQAVSGHFSVVIPTKNRLEGLQKVIESLLAQVVVPKEIIIVDQSIPPLGKEILDLAWPPSRGTQMPSLVYVHDPRISGAAQARNEGLRRASGTWVLFLDDDVFLSRDCLFLLGRALAEKPFLLGVGGVISNYVRPPLLSLVFRRLFYLGAFWDERQAIYWNATAYPPGQLIPTAKLNGGCMAFKREVLLSIGGFDENYVGPSVGEDVEVSYRLIRMGGRDDALALVGGALLEHRSLGGWKHSERFLEFEIVATHYWSRKNLPQTAGNKIRFWWMVFGISLRGVASGMRHRSLMPLRSVYAGICSILSGYRNCPFLKVPGCRAGPAGGI